MIVTVSRKAHFNAAHRLYRKDWSGEKNSAVLASAVTLIFMDIITSLLLV